MRSTVLITGASGWLGGAVAQRFLREPVHAIALVHAQLPRGRMQCVRGDITRRRLGLAAGEYRALASRVTDVLHCAANTEFAVSREIAEKTNLAGTQNVIAFAQECRQLRKIGVLSTVYVAGRRRGEILESELEHRAGFVNAYEASKYRMEQFLRICMDRLPIAVYRLSTILGDARTGRVEGFNALHRALRLYHNGLVPMVPGERSSLVDLISSDYASQAIFHLFRFQFRPGETYHIVAGEKNCPRLSDFLETTADLFARFDNRWRARAVSIPPVAPLETFQLLEESIEKTGNRVLQQIVRGMRVFVPQLCYPKRFDDSNTRKGLTGSGIRPRPLEEYYPKIIRHCLKAQWGSGRCSPSADS
jgi:nucleoside-diphosphate-sugar epimerase